MAPEKNRVYEGKLDDLVSEIDFEKLQNLLTSSLRARGTLNLLRTLASDRHRFCGPIVLAVTLDEMEFFSDWDRQDNTYFLQTVLVCPGDVIALSNLHTNVEESTGVVGNEISRFPKKSIVLKPENRTLVQINATIWNKDAFPMNSELEIKVEGFEITSKNFSSNRSSDILFLINNFEANGLVDGFSNKKYSYLSASVWVTALPMMCHFFSTENLLVDDENMGKVASDVVWNLNLKKIDSNQKDLVEYNNRFRLKTDVICQGMIDLFIPKLPDAGEFILTSLVGYQNQSANPASLRLQLELFMHDIASRNRICEHLPSRDKLDELSSILCLNGKLKHHMQILLSMTLSSTVAEEEPLYKDTTVTRIFPLSNVRVIANVIQIGQAVSLSYNVEDIAIDSDDIFMFCSSSSSEMKIQVCFAKIVYCNKK